MEQIQKKGGILACDDYSHIPDTHHSCCSPSIINATTRHAIGVKCGVAAPSIALLLLVQASSRPNNIFRERGKSQDLIRYIDSRRYICLLIAYPQESIVQYLQNRVYSI